MSEVGRQAKEFLQLSRQDMITAWIKLKVVKTVSNGCIVDLFFSFLFKYIVPRGLAEKLDGSAIN